MSRFRFPHFFLLYIVLLHSALSAAQTPVPEPPVQSPRSHNYDVQHYRIKIGFDWQKKSISGTTTITLTPSSSSLREVELDAGEMTIADVKLAAGTPLQFRYVDNQKLYVTLDKLYRPGQSIQLVIGYSATPRRGLTFITPDEYDRTRPYQIWSQGEAQDNHYWFPCYDFPNDKATSEVIATVEHPYQVISNGRLVSTQTHAAQKSRTFHWRLEQPSSSYLISIIVGQYAEVRERYKRIPISSFVYPDQVENARVSFAKLARMVEFFSQKVGYDYPYAKYAQTMVRDFPGAMENITATTMTDTAVHDRRAHLDLSSDNLVSHELAHSWFGNLVTCRDWSELWLNEAFASFMEAVWTEHEKSGDDALYEMHNNQQGYLQAWTQGYRRPMVTSRFNDPDGLFDAYVYPRGAAVVHMLRFVLGEASFWKVIRHYLKKHQWQSVETQQLVVAIEDVTGQNLQWFFDQWLYKMGHPEFDIATAYNESAKQLTLNIKQTQKPDDQRRWYPSADVFRMPVDIAVTTASGEAIHRVWIDEKAEEVHLAVDSRPLIVNFDRGNYLIKQVRFARSDDDLIYQLLHDRDAMGRVRAAIELQNRKSEAAIKALTEAATRDRFSAVRLEAAKGLVQVRTPVTRAALLEIVKDRESSIRRVAVQGLGSFQDAALADFLIHVIHTDGSYFVIADAARALAQTASPKAYEALTAALKLDSWLETIRRGVLDGLIVLKDPRTFALAQQYAAPEQPVAMRAAALELMGVTAKGQDGVFETLAAALREPSLQIQLSAAAGLAALGDQRAISLLEELANKSVLPPYARQSIANAIQQLKK